jgi:tetratricopeptide (TPR) repeat protein
MNTKNLSKSLRIQKDLLQTCLNQIRDEVKAFWKNWTFLEHYTNHDVDHSERVIGILDKLLDETPDMLNEHERFILLASAYLHDIGMQSPTHAGLPQKIEYSMSEKETVRERHNESSAKMILIDEVEDTSFDGEKLRLRLLIALLRLADELDQDHRRVNMKILKRKDIPVMSKFHWWSHHYVQSLLIEKGKIKLYFRFPENYRQEERIIKAFCNQVMVSIKRQFFEVYPILDLYGLRLYREPMIEKVAYVPEGVVELIPEDLLDHINEKILKPEERSQKVGRETGVVWFVDGVPYSDDVEVANRLSNLLKAIEEDRYSEALEEIEKGRLLTMAPKEKMIWLLNAGNCFLIFGKLSNAKAYYDDALKISERKDLQEIYKKDLSAARTTALGNIGLVYRAKGELDNALKCLKEALKIDQAIGYKRGEANQLGSIGAVYLEKGELDNALKCHQDALSIYKKMGYKEGESCVLCNIGLIYSEKGDLGNALKCQKEALKIDQTIGYKRGEASELCNIGAVYLEKGELDNALKCQKEALKIAQEIGYKEVEASALRNIFRIYSEKGDLDNALKCLKEALKIAQEIGNKEGEAYALGNIGVVYGAKGDFDNALKYLKDALKIVDRFKLVCRRDTLQTVIDLITKDLGGED